MPTKKLVQIKVLNNKVVYEVILKALTQSYPEAENSYEAAKMHLQNLKNMIGGNEVTGKDYDHLIAETLYFEWFVKLCEQQFYKQYHVSQN